MDKIEKFSELAELLKAIAHPTRLSIVHGLWENGGCNVSHMQECLGQPQSTISQQLAKLRAAGIVRTDRRGLEVYYELSDERIEKMLAALFSEDEK